MMRFQVVNVYAINSSTFVQWVHNTRKNIRQEKQSQSRDNGGFYSRKRVHFQLEENTWDMNKEEDDFDPQDMGLLNHMNGIRMVGVNMQGQSVILELMGVDVECYLRLPLLTDRTSDEYGDNVNPNGGWTPERVDELVRNSIFGGKTKRLRYNQHVPILSEQLLRWELVCKSPMIANSGLDQFPYIKFYFKGTMEDWNWNYKPCLLAPIFIRELNASVALKLCETDFDICTRHFARYKSTGEEGDSPISWFTIPREAVAVREQLRGSRSLYYRCRWRPNIIEADQACIDRAPIPSVSLDFEAINNPTQKAKDTTKSAKETGMITSAALVDVLGENIQQTTIYYLRSHNYTVDNCPHQLGWIKNLDARTEWVREVIEKYAPGTSCIPPRFSIAQSIRANTTIHDPVFGSTRILFFDTRREMLLAIVRHIGESGALCLLGYNIDDYDLWLLYMNIMAEFGDGYQNVLDQMSMFIFEPVVRLQNEKHSDARGVVVRDTLHLPGRFILDLYPEMRTLYRRELPQFNLGVVMKHVFPNNPEYWKVDNDFRSMFLLWYLGFYEHELKYVARDAQVVVILATNRQILTSKMALGKFAKATMDTLLYKMQTARIVTAVNPVMEIHHVIEHRNILPFRGLPWAEKMELEYKPRLAACTPGRMQDPRWRDAFSRARRMQYKPLLTLLKEHQTREQPNTDSVFTPESEAENPMDVQQDQYMSTTTPDRENIPTLSVANVFTQLPRRVRRAWKRLGQVLINLYDLPLWEVVADMKPLPALTKATGGKVQRPLVNFWDIPIGVLDFNSLYPSIILAFCICFVTVFADPRYKKWAMRRGYRIMTRRTRDKEDVVADVLQEFPDEHPSLKPIIPLVVDKMLQCRRMYKDMQKQPGLITSTRELYFLYEMAVKAWNNSIYGFTLKRTGETYKFPLMGELIPAIGRDLIDQIVRIAKGVGATIVYGDTDSIMITWVMECLKIVTDKPTAETRRAVLAHMWEKMEYVTTLCNTEMAKISPHLKIALEKLLMNALFQTAKNYSAEKYTSKTDELGKVKIHYAGNPVVRGTTEPYIKGVLSNISERIHREAVTDCFASIIASAVADLRCKAIPEQIPLRQFCKSVAVTKYLPYHPQYATSLGHRYTNIPAHGYAACKMHEKDTRLAPDVNNKILTLVLTHPTKAPMRNKKVSDRTFMVEHARMLMKEDPAWQIDRMYIIRAILRSLTNHMRCIFGEEATVAYLKAYLTIVDNYLTKNQISIQHMELTRAETIISNRLRPIVRARRENESHDGSLTDEEVKLRQEWWNAVYKVFVQRSLPKEIFLSVMEDAARNSADDIESLIQQQLALELTTEEAEEFDRQQKQKLASVKSTLANSEDDGDSDDENTSDEEI